MLRRIILSALIIVLLVTIAMKLYKNQEESNVQENMRQTEQFAEENIYLSENIEVIKDNDNAIHEVTDEQFVGFINDLYEYPKDYENQQFRIRGHYRTRIVSGEVKHYIYQGKDERWIGVSISNFGEMPAEGSILQVVGTIRVTISNKKEIPYLELSSVIVIRAK